MHENYKEKWEKDKSLQAVADLHFLGKVVDKLSVWLDQFQNLDQSEQSYHFVHLSDSSNSDQCIRVWVSIKEGVKWENAEYIYSEPP